MRNGPRSGGEREGAGTQPKLQDLLLWRFRGSATAINLRTFEKVSGTACLNGGLTADIFRGLPWFVSKVHAPPPPAFSGVPSGPSTRFT